MEQSQAAGFGNRPSKFVHEASLLASCFRCGRAHPASHPLSVCATCVGMYRARRDYDDFGGSGGLDNTAQPFSTPGRSGGNLVLGR